MSEVPPVIITEIISRLPVKSLLRFRCVTKTVNATIESSAFIQDHLRQQKSRVKLLVDDGTVYTVEYDSIDSIQLVSPVKLPDGPANVLGTCHGLVLLMNNQKGFLLWNPSTKLYRKLPDRGFKPPAGSSEFSILTCAGLGYDSSSEDYKVVTLTRWLISDVRYSQLMIYSLKLDSWKKVNGCPYQFCFHGALVGGVLHWTGSMDPSGPEIILGINLGNEKFEQVPYPDNLGNQSLLKLSVFEECLCLMSSHATADKDFVLEHSIDIWVMKEYGVKQSWAKLFSLGHGHGCQQIYNFCHLWLISYSRTGGEVLLQMDKSKLLWYSLENNSIEKVEISGESRILETFVCLETLVPLHGGGVRNDREKNIAPDTKRGKGPNRKRGDGFLSKGFNLKL